MLRAPVLYQETRLSPSPASPYQVLDINTTSQQQSSSISAGRKRGFDEISGLDEESYARKYLATEGSVFFRRKDRAPRSFLWRLVEDRRVVEIQAVDLIHDTKRAKSECWLTFRLFLPSEVVRNGVAFADPDETDALEVFVLTTGNELFTFTLKRDLLTRDSMPSEFDATTCFKKYTSHSLAFRHPYRMVAVSSLEILISIHDGGLMRLTRQANDSGVQWRETFFSEGGWGGTLRGLISLKRHQTVRYGNLELEPSAIAAMAKSPDKKYIWTVSLDHDVKAWSTETGKSVAHLDVLGGVPREEGGKMGRYVMGAEQGTLMQVVTLPTSPEDRSVARAEGMASYFLVLHSPKDHQFKFYEASPRYTHVEGEHMKLEDLSASHPLIPPIDELMNTNIWHLENFHVQPGLDWQENQIWIRARSGTLCRTFTLSFDLLGEDGMALNATSAWKHGWTVVDPGLQTVEALRAYNDFPGDLESMTDGASTPTEKWLDFICHPGRFSPTSIETALHIYRKGRGLPPLSSSGRGINATELPLQERLAQTISSKIILRRLPNEHPDYVRYQADIQEQWKTFFSLLAHLHTRRHDSIGFAFDAETALPWSIFADFVSPIRATSYFDALILNEHLLDDAKLQSVDANVAQAVFPDDEATYFTQLLATAKAFRARLSPEFREKFQTLAAIDSLRHDIGDESNSGKRVQVLYESSGLNSEVMDDDFQALERSAENLGGLGMLSDSMILGVLEARMLEGEEKGFPNTKSLDRYGDKLTIAAAQEILERDRNVLLDMLTLVTFMYGDLDQADLAEEFVDHIGSIYDAIIVRLKHNEMMAWLVKNLIPEPARLHRSTRSSQNLEQPVNTITLLERIFIGDWAPKSEGARTMPELLTLWIKQWVYGLDLFQNWDGVSGHVMAFLVKAECYELATEFQKFLSQGEESSSWLRYIEGRLLMATGDYALASLKFKFAAEGMAEATRIAGSDTAYLLSAEERNHFGSGMSSFYQHVSSLFEKLRAYSYTADFAQLALACLDSDDDLANSMADVDRRKGAMDSPALHRVTATEEESNILKVFERKKEILTRLFNAQMQTGRVREAFDALAQIHDSAMKKSNLATLIKACVDQDAVPSLLELPFEEGELVQEADGILLGLAKRSLESGSTAARPYHQVLYAFRTQRSNFRGAAEILYEYLERLRFSLNKDGIQDPEDETLIQAYVLLINTLACCSEEDAWLLADPIEEVSGVGAKRKLVTIAEVRREYGAELDRRSDILQGRFPLVAAADEMDFL